MNKAYKVLNATKQAAQVTLEVFPTLGAAMNKIAHTVRTPVVFLSDSVVYDEVTGNREWSVYRTRTLRDCDGYAIATVQEVG